MLKQPFGPYRVLSGLHIEPTPVKDVTISLMDGNTLHLATGETMEITSGNDVLFKGEHYALYIERDGGGVRRISPNELRSVSEKRPASVTLVQPVQHDKSSKPFMSFRKLTEVFVNKFVHDRGGDAQAEEVDTLKRRIADLEARLAGRDTAPAEKNLDSMTERELREYAESEEIDVSECKTKAQVRETINRVMQTA